MRGTSILFRSPMRSSKISNPVLSNFLTFITVRGKEQQHRIVPQKISFTNQGWTLTFKNPSTNKLSTVLMSKIISWVDIPNEKIDTPGRVY